MNMKIEDYTSCIEHLLESEGSEAIRQDDKNAKKETSKEREAIHQTQKQIRISISQSDAIKLRMLLLLPGSSIRKGLRNITLNYIRKQYKDNEERLEEHFKQFPDLQITK